MRLEWLSVKLEGILAATVTPFTEEGAVDHAALRSYLDGFWSRSLAAFKSAVEAEREEER